MADTSPMTLRVLTPTGVAAELGCTGVRLSIPDDAHGRGGGQVGILPDHAPAVLALAPGEVRASRDGEVIFRARVERGFASVSGNVVTVLTDSAAVEEA